MLHYLTGGAWDPHDFNTMALTCDSSVQLWDLRTMKYVLFNSRSCIFYSNEPLKICIVNIQEAILKLCNRCFSNIIDPEMLLCDFVLCMPF